jgi:hypothetical protein
MAAFRVVYSLFSVSEEVEGEGVNERDLCKEKGCKANNWEPM